MGIYVRPLNFTSTIMHPSDPAIEEMLSSIDLGSSWKQLAAQTTDKDYRRIVAFDNATSYSQLLELHRCPRRFQLMKSNAKEPSQNQSPVQENLDFAFGHSVGAGIQTLIATGSLEKGLFAAFVSWKADYFADKDSVNASYGKKSSANKSLAYAQFAVEKFYAQGLSSEWELYYLPSGKPGVEISFCIDLENGYKHYGHIDLVLRNKNSGAIGVWELKTHGRADVDEASYANSSQGLGYGIILDHIEPNLSEYDVNYAVYSSPSLEWTVIPFRKTLLNKASWLAEILLDQSAVSTYRKMNFFPKYGENCVKWNRRCEYFGMCDLTSQVTYVDSVPGQYAEEVDILITKSEIIQSQRTRGTE